MKKLLLFILISSTSLASEKKEIILPDTDISILDKRFNWEATTRVKGKLESKKIKNTRETLFIGKSWVCFAGEATINQTKDSIEPSRSINCAHMRANISSSASVLCDQKGSFCSGFLTVKDEKEEVDLILIGIGRD